MPEFHLNILDAKRQKIFAQLNFLKDLGAYLAGGTALALQIGHRASVDFDFYTSKHFKRGELALLFKDKFKSAKLEVIRDQDDTFEISLNGVHTSFFYYPYKLLKILLNLEGVLITSAEDIAAMKLLAISQRGKRRDFIDMYYLIKMFGLDSIIEMTKKKFPEFDIYNGLRGLVFFDEADNDPEIKRVKAIRDRLNWKTLKKFIQQKVFEYQRNSKL